MDKVPIKIILAGEGGQGIQTIAKIISLAAFRSNYHVSYLPSFGVEQRGTPSIAYLVIGQKEIKYPHFEVADRAVILSERAIRVTEKKINNQTTVIFDSSIINKNSFSAGKLLGIPATELASSISTKSFNILIAAKLCQSLSFNKKLSWGATTETLSKKFETKKIRDRNKRIFDLGWNSILENHIYSKQTFKSDTGTLTFKNDKNIGSVYIEKCKGCGLCLEVCPVGAIKFGSKIGILGNPIPEIDIDKCIGCGKCYNICPDVAIQVIKINK